MPGPPYEYISGLILRYMEDYRFAGLRGRRVRRRRRKVVVSRERGKI